MSLQVIRSFYVGDTLYQDGQVLESDDQELIAKAIADGNVAEAVVTEPSPEAPATDDPLVDQPVDSGSVEPQAPAVVQPPADPVPVIDPKNPSPEQIQDDLQIA
jgi:outer membrane biosynthesis protein TonB